jgi:AraC family transcriptional regulator
MEPVWSELTRRVEGNLRRTIGEGPAIEIYLNDASDTAPQDLITDLYLPVL